MIISSVTISACATVGMKPTRAVGSSSFEYLSDKSENPTSSKAEEINQNLYRSARGRYEPPFTLSVEAVPRTVAYVRAKVRESLLKKSYKEKWNNEKETYALKEGDKEAIRSAMKATCFDFKTTVGTLEAKDRKAWYATLIVEDKEIPGIFSEFTGFRKDTTTTYYSSGIGNSFTTSEYFLYADICFPRKIDYLKKFVLKIEPRYEEGITPIFLEWLPPDSNGKRV